MDLVIARQCVLYVHRYLLIFMTALIIRVHVMSQNSKAKLTIEKQPLNSQLPRIETVAIKVTNDKDIGTPVLCSAAEVRLYMVNLLWS